MRYDYNALAALGPAVNYKLNVVHTTFLLSNAIQQVVLPRTSLDDDNIDADTIDGIDADTIDSSIDADTDDEDNNNQQEDDICPAAKKTCRVHDQRAMNELTWWTYFLLPVGKAELLRDPDGKLSYQFRQAFRISYLTYKVKIFEFSVATWWLDWHENKVDASRRPISNLELMWPVHFDIVNCENRWGNSESFYDSSMIRVLAGFPNVPGTYVV